MLQLSQSEKLWTAWLLIFANILINVSTDIYLPSLVAIIDEFDATNLQAQLMLALFILGSTIGRVFWGAVSDHLGRKNMLIASMLIQTIALLGCAFSTDMNTLLFFRVVQSLGAAVNTVMGTAMISDIFHGSERAKYMGIIELTFPIGFIIGPVLGAYIFHHSNDWRMCFYIMTATFAFCSVMLIFKTTETLHEKSTETAHQTLKHFHTIATNRAFLTYTTIVGLIICSFLIFVVASPLIMMKQLGVSPLEYGYFQMVPMLVSLFAMIAFRHFVHAHGIDSCLKFGLSGIMIMPFLYALIAFELVMINPFTITAVVATQSIFVSFIIPGLISHAMDLFPKNKGVAASMIGFMRSLLSSFGMILMSVIFGPNISITFTVMMVIISITSVMTLMSWKTIFSHSAAYGQKSSNHA